MAGEEKRERERVGVWFREKETYRERRVMESEQIQRCSSERDPNLLILHSLLIFLLNSLT